jgi:hypothetical protein
VLNSCAGLLYMCCAALVPFSRINVMSMCIAMCADRAQVCAGQLPLPAAARLRGAPKPAALLFSGDHPRAPCRENAVLGLPLALLILQHACD